MKFGLEYRSKRGYLLHQLNKWQRMRKMVIILINEDCLPIVNCRDYTKILNILNDNGLDICRGTMYNYFEELKIRKFKDTEITEAHLNRLRKIKKNIDSELEKLEEKRKKVMCEEEDSVETHPEFEFENII